MTTTFSLCGLSRVTAAFEALRKEGGCSNVALAGDRVVFEQWLVTDDGYGSRCPFLMTLPADCKALTAARVVMVMN